MIRGHLHVNMSLPTAAASDAANNRFQLKGSSSASSKSCPRSVTATGLSTCDIRRAITGTLMSQQYEDEMTLLFPIGLRSSHEGMISDLYNQKYQGQ